MRTDGLYAFDAETRMSIERKLRPLAKRRERAKRDYVAKVKPPKAPKPAPLPRPEAVSTRAARLWLAHKAEGGTITQLAWATEHGIKEKTLSAAIYYLQNPDALAAKNKRLRARYRERRALR